MALVAPVALVVAVALAAPVALVTPVIKMQFLSYDDNPACQFNWSTSYSLIKTLYC